MGEEVSNSRRNSFGIGWAGRQRTGNCLMRVELGEWQNGHFQFMVFIFPVK